jgi:hypothetical protein
VIVETSQGQLIDTGETRGLDEHLRDDGVAEQTCLELALREARLRRDLFRAPSIVFRHQCLQSRPQRRSRDAEHLALGETRKDYRKSCVPHANYGYRTQIMVSCLLFDNLIVLLCAEGIDVVTLVQRIVSQQTTIN